ncbi:MAG: hypothetical protein OEY79_02130 [Anaplasmataceae bacterium]|nr:hypothetical protein [Anaplasmataceae bacterium]
MIGIIEEEQDTLIIYFSSGSDQFREDKDKNNFILNLHEQHPNAQWVNINWHFTVNSVGHFYDNGFDEIKKIEM